nr:MAG TPA: Hydrogen maturase F tetramerization domain protein [Caudoviricetes sp.]
MPYIYTSPSSRPEKIKSRHNLDLIPNCAGCMNSVPFSGTCSII